MFAAGQSLANQSQELSQEALSTTPTKAAQSVYECA